MNVVVAVMVQPAPVVTITVTISPSVIRFGTPAPEVWVDCNEGALTCKPLICHSYRAPGIGVACIAIGAPVQNVLLVIDVVEIAIAGIAPIVTFISEESSKQELAVAVLYTRRCTSSLSTSEAVENVVAPPLA